MNTLRWTHSPVVALSALALLAACGGEGGSGSPAADTGGEPERGGSAILVEAVDMSVPLSIVSESLTDSQIGGMMFMSLMGGDWREGELVYQTSAEHPMALARSYEFVGPDSASLRYHMRSDVQWSDGRPVTARDVAFTYGILGEPELASAQQNYVEALDSVVADNDSTVTFHYARRYPEMLFHSASLAPVPEHVFKNVPLGQYRSHPSVTDPVGGKLLVNGPFMISRWDKGSTITLVRNPRFKPAPYLDQIVIRIIPETVTRQVELQTGNVDFVNKLNFEAIPSIRQQNPNIRLEREERRFYEYIAYNPAAHPAFADRDIRRALGMALDIKGMLNALQMGEYAEPAGGPYAPIFKKYYDPVQQAPVGYDPERAKQILESKGWRDTNGDGIREKDGRTLSFELTTNTGNALRADVAQIVQQQWKQVGVDARVRLLEFNTFIDNLIGKKYEAGLAGWSVALSADISTIWRPGVPYNYVSYDNPEVIRLFDQALAQRTEEAAIPYWKRAAALIVQDQPYTWLHYQDQVDGVNNRLRNTKVNTLGRYLNPWEWWIPASQQRGGPVAKDTAPTE